MKFFSIIAVSATMALSACVSDGIGSTTTMTKAANAVTPLIGKKLVNDSATFIFNSDGTIGGQFRDQPIVGSYKATATESCSVYTAPQQLTGREYCSTPVISGNTVIFNRRDGSNSGEYTIEG